LSNPPRIILLILGPEKVSSINSSTCCAHCINPICRSLFFFMRTLFYFTQCEF